MTERPFVAGVPAPWPPSLWAAVTPEDARYPALRGDAACDVAVVGGGFAGLNAALTLAESGARVRVLEANRVGWGASGRNNGQLIAGLKRDPAETMAELGPERGRRLLELASDAPRQVFALIARLGIACDAVNRGWVQPAHAASALPLIERRVEQWRAFGVAAALVPRSKVAARLGTDWYAGAWFDPRGGSLNPLAYARGLAAAAAARGAAIAEETPVTALAREGAAWRLDTPGGTVTADAVLLCVNGYGGDGFAAIRGAQMPVRSAQVATAPLPEALRRTILPGGEAASDTCRLLTSFRITADGRLIMGGADATAGDHRPGLTAWLHRAAAERFPHLGTLAWDYGWSGYWAITADHRPAIHAAGPGLWNVVACNGRGIALASVAGQAAARLALGRAPAECAIPVVPPRGVPFRALRRIGVPMRVWLERWRDRRDRRART